MMRSASGITIVMLSLLATLIIALASGMNYAFNTMSNKTGVYQPGYVTGTFTSFLHPFVVLIVGIAILVLILVATKRISDVLG